MSFPNTLKRAWPGLLRTDYMRDLGWEGWLKQERSNALQSLKELSKEACFKTLVCKCVPVPMLLLSYLPEVENCNSSILPYGQPCWHHRRDQNPLDIALHAWKLIHNCWIRPNYVGLLRCKLGHRSEDNVRQSPHPNKHTQMCANENW